MQKLFSKCMMIVLAGVVTMVHPVSGMESNSSNYSTMVVKDISDQQLQELWEEEDGAGSQQSEQSKEKPIQEELVNLAQKQDGKWFLTFRSKKTVKVIKDLLQWDIGALEEKIKEQADLLNEIGRDKGNDLTIITRLKNENKASKAALNTLQHQLQQLQQEKTVCKETITALGTRNQDAQSWPQTLANPKVYALPTILIVAWIGTHYASRFAWKKRVKRFLSLISVQKRG